MMAFSGSPTNLSTFWSVLASYALSADAYAHTFVWVVVLCALCIPLALWLRLLERPAQATAAAEPTAAA